VYVDNRLLISRPSAWHVVIDAFAAVLPGVSMAGSEPDLIAGVESAGIPHSSALAFATGRPCVYVRKAAKEHGLARRVEGGDVVGRSVVLVEDMVTTGGSSLAAVQALRDEGAAVSGCLAIITYGFPEARSAFEAAGVALTVLTTFEHVVREASARGGLDPTAAQLVRAWLADPHAWDPGRQPSEVR
jgi:orotate phosphoribosyltransferase